MDVAWIFIKARRDCFVEVADYSDADALIDLNLIYDHLNSRIIEEVDEDFYWDSSVDATVVWQSEYPIETTGSFDIVEVNKVFIKYTATDEPIQARRVSPLSLTKHPSWYTANQSKADPIYYVQDNSVFLYPAATEVVSKENNWMEIYTINMPLPLEAAWAESTIKIPKRFHRLLPLGLKQYIYVTQGKLNEKNDAVAEFDAAADKMISQLRDRDQWEIIETTPDLSHLE